MAKGALWFRLFTSWCTLLHTTDNLVHSMQINQLALDKFRSLKAEKPRSKIALLRALYPEIAAVLRTGHSQLDIHQRLVKDGIDISYPLLRNYLSRIRRETPHSPLSQNSQPLRVTAPTKKGPAGREDPLASAMRALSKPRYDIREAMCDGDPTKKKVVLTVRFHPVPFLTK